MAMDKWAEIKTNTQKSLSDAMNKKNLISLNIEPRKFIIPINRNDIFNSKWLQLEVGYIKLKNTKLKDSLYQEKNDICLEKVDLTFYENINNLQNNINPFKIIYDTKFNVGIAILPKTEKALKTGAIKLFIDINSVKFQLNEYVFSLLITIDKILK